jgi:shikimate 5-dehydrogenase
MALCQIYLDKIKLDVILGKNTDKNGFSKDLIRNNKNREYGQKYERF